MEEKEQTSTPRTLGMTRRTLCIGAIGAAALLGLGGAHLVGKTQLLRPPGGQDEAAFFAACTRCGMCIEACPRGIIVPSKMEDGIIEMLTPTLNFDNNWCDWCQENSSGSQPRCVAACPTLALGKPQDATPQTNILGIAVVNTETCLAYRTIGCRYCSEICTYDAITLDENYRPSVVAERCNGCGACETVCISQQDGSVRDSSGRRAIHIVPVVA